MRLVIDNMDIHGYASESRVPLNPTMMKLIHRALILMHKSKNVEELSDYCEQVYFE
jgi:hypothetical protein